MPKWLLKPLVPRYMPHQKGHFPVRLGSVAFRLPPGIPSVLTGISEILIGPAVRNLLNVFNSEFCSVCMYVCMYICMHLFIIFKSLPPENMFIDFRERRRKRKRERRHRSVASHGCLDQGSNLPTQICALTEKQTCNILVNGVVLD